MQNESDTVQPPAPPLSRPKVRWPISRLHLPGYTIFYTSLAGVLGAVVVAPLAWWQGWGNAWIAAAVVAGWRGLLLGAWVVMADRAVDHWRRPFRWGLGMLIIGFVPDAEIGLFAYLAFVPKAFLYPPTALYIWIVIAALRDGLLGLALGYTAEAARGWAWKSAAAAVIVWAAYRVAGIVAKGPLLGLPVEVYESIEALAQVSLCMLISAGFIGWAFAACLRNDYTMTK